VSLLVLKRAGGGELWTPDLDWAWTHFWCCVLREVHLDQLGWWASEIIEGAPDAD
jgi:hypothetical protein